MNQPNFTPGPWKATPTGRIIVVTVDDGFSVIASTPRASQIDSPVEAIANARLIAAAPDLYAALRLFAESISLPCTNEERAALEAAWAALGKAEGGGA